MVWTFAKGFGLFSHFWSDCFVCANQFALNAQIEVTYFHPVFLKVLETTLCFLVLALFISLVAVTWKYIEIIILNIFFFVIIVITVFIIIFIINYSINTITIIMTTFFEIGCFFEQQEELWIFKEKNQQGQSLLTTCFTHLVLHLLVAFNN